ncbi:hypothetical protein, partial [Pseudomonas shirazica]|uniref:hypothetical protein n=2 Tax=Pseudomonas shirazica TaxID=1940636 RepID=UPI001C268E31
PARRFAAQGCSYICFGPVTPVPAHATALFARRDIEVDAKAVACRSHRNNWPETNGRSSLVLRSAARAALDLTGARKPKTATSQSQCHLKTGTRQP